MKGFNDLFLCELKELYCAECQSAKMMPEVIKSARSSELQKALEEHLAETESQIKRLEQVSTELKESFGKGKCAPMEGLWDEWKHIVKEHFDDEVQDAAIISFIQKVKHYEIASYGTLKTFAEHLELSTIKDLLDQSIKEEALADKKLTELAMCSDGINTKACKKRSA